MKKVNAVIERAGDGTYSIYMDDDNFDYLVTGTGATVDEAKKVFIGGYDDVRNLYAEEKKPFEEVDFNFKYDVASLLAYYVKIMSLQGLAHISGIAPQRLDNYVSGRSVPSQQTLGKIQCAMHSFATDIGSARFA